MSAAAVIIALVYLFGMVRLVVGQLKAGGAA
jgi:hypothetical protein